MTRNGFPSASSRRTIGQFYVPRRIRHRISRPAEVLLGRDQPAVGRRVDVTADTSRDRRCRRARLPRRLAGRRARRAVRPKPSACRSSRLARAGARRQRARPRGRRLGRRTRRDAAAAASPGSTSRLRQPRTFARHGRGGQAPTFGVTGLAARPGRPRAAPRRPVLPPWPPCHGSRAGRPRESHVRPPWREWQTHRPPPAGAGKGAGSVVNRCGVGCSAGGRRAVAPPKGRRHGSAFSVS